ncbi:MAG: transposase [Candidatus Gottesmanbacteria bacterium]
MASRKTILASKQYYHIYNRGHNKQQIFLQQHDYRRYIERMEEYLEKHEITILAYCLMPNHVHFLIRQDGNEATQQFIHRLHTAYTMFFNKKYERVGSVFQGRFRARMIDSEGYLLHISRYIHQNPIDLFSFQGRALSLKDYPWSSYRYYTQPLFPSPICNTSILLNYFSKTHKQMSYTNFVEGEIKQLLKSPEKMEKINNGDF